MFSFCFWLETGAAMKSNRFSRFSLVTAVARTLWYVDFPSALCGSAIAPPKLYFYCGVFQSFLNEPMRGMFARADRC